MALCYNDLKHLKHISNTSLFEYLSAPSSAIIAYYVDSEICSFRRSLTNSAKQLMISFCMFHDNTFALLDPYSIYRHQMQVYMISVPYKHASFRAKITDMITFFLQPFKYSFCRKKFIGSWNVMVFVIRILFLGK